MAAYYCIHIYTSVMQYTQKRVDVLLGQNLRVFLSVVMLLMGLSALKQLRMFKNISNLIVTLQTNLVDISSFMIVLAIAICSYSAILLFLWMKPRDFAAADQEVPEDLDDPSVNNLSTVFNAVITVVYMATGSFETGLFDNTLQKILAVIFVIIFVICIFIVMMNALIAILGDSYERVQNSRVSTE